jgi:hypothetical protein
LPLGQKSSLARLVAAGFLLPYSDGNKLALAAQELALAVPSDFGFTIMATEPSFRFHNSNSYITDCKQKPCRKVSALAWLAKYFDLRVLRFGRLIATTWDVRAFL